MNWKNLPSATMVSLLLVGCGDDEKESGSGSATVNEAVARASVQNVIGAAQTAIDSNDGVGAAFRLAGEAQAMNAIVTPASGQSSYGERRAGPSGGCSSGTADCTDTSCTFDACSNQTWTIDGMVSWDGGHLVCDLTITGSFSGFSYTFTETCDLTIAETSIDGTLNVDASYMGEIEGRQFDVDYTSDVTFNEVTFDASGCLTGGSVDVSATFSGVVDGREANYSASGSVTFSGCAP